MSLSSAQIANRQWLAARFIDVPADSAELVGWLEATCGAMRAYGISGGWAYSKPAHQTLIDILNAERAALASEILPASPGRQEHLQAA